jgi:hypothetical protein
VGAGFFDFVFFEDETGWATEASTGDGMTSPAWSMSSSAWAVTMSEWCGRGPASSASRVTRRAGDGWKFIFFMRANWPQDGAITSIWQMVLVCGPKQSRCQSHASACGLGVGLSGSPVWRSVMASLLRADDGGGGAMVGGIEWFLRRSAPPKITNSWSGQWAGRALGQ